MENWITNAFDNTSLVINSKVSLSRNIKDILFSNKLDENTGRKVVGDIENIFFSNTELFRGFKFIKLWECDDFFNMFNFEKLLIEHKLIKNKNISAFIINEDETIIVLINGSNHLKIQGIINDLNLENAFDKINKIDDMFERNLRYAFDEKLGYLTSSPMNLGSGLKVSTMIHLPGIVKNKKIKSLVEELSKVGLNVLGSFTEELNECSNIYKIYNNKSIGICENEIISKLKAIVEQLILKEQKERGKMLSDFKFETFNTIFRSIGILSNSYIISLKEALKLLSNVRMGVEMSIINNVDKKTLNKLLVNIQSLSLKNMFKQNDNVENEDIARAKYIRDILTNNL